MSQFITEKSNTDIRLPECPTSQNSAKRAMPMVHIIDDSDDMRMFLTDELKNDYLVVDSENGLTGFDTAASILPDIIICDVFMPGINGIKLCKLLKEDQRTRRIPVLLLTSDGTDECLLDGLKSGADGYVTKPFNFVILKARIDNLLKSRKVFEELLNETIASPHHTELKHIDDPFLKKAYEIIERNLGDPAFEANDFARAIGMSRAQIYRKIKAVTGQSVKEFIRITRLQESARLLVDGNQNVSEIAYQVGFSSVAYFSSSFKSYFKLSPSKYVLNRINKSPEGL